MLHWYRARKVERMDWPTLSPDLNPIDNLWHQISCLISKSKPRKREETYRTSYCGMFSSDLTGRADKTSRFTTSTLQNDDLKSRMAKKIFNQHLKPKRLFSGLQFFEKSGSSLAAPLHNFNCIKCENCIFVKNAMVVGSKVLKCDY